MADTFKVVQYWIFESNIRSSNSSSTMARVGVSVFFLKQTMFKSQVNGGVKDELSIAAKKWCQFSCSKLKLASTMDSSNITQLNLDDEIKKNFMESSSGDINLIPVGILEKNESSYGIPTRSSSSSSLAHFDSIGPSESISMKKDYLFSLKNTAIFFMFIFCIYTFWMSSKLSGQIGKLEQEIKDLRKLYHHEKTLHNDVIYENKSIQFLNELIDSKLESCRSK
jgi:hypothetical protein